MSRATSALFGRRRMSSGVPICSVVPACSTQMRSARLSASSRSWVTSSIGMSSARCSAAISSFSGSRVMRSTAENGSSSKQNLRIAGERTRQRDALALAARELIGLARLEAGKMYAGEQLRGIFAAARLFDTQLGEAHVVEGREMREQRVVLEDEPDAACLRRQIDAGLGVEPRLGVDADKARPRAGRARRSSAAPSSCRCPKARRSPAARRAGSSAPRRAGWARPAAAAPIAALPHAPCASTLGRRASMCTMAMAAIEKPSSTADMTPACSRRNACTLS